MKILKKISTATIIGTKPNVRAIPEEGTLALYSVGGRVSGLKTGETSNGPWLALTGEFIAVRVSDSEQFMAGVAFIPGATADVLAGAFRSNPQTVIEFAVRVGVRLDSTSATGYVYEVETVEAPKTSDAMARIAGLLKGPEQLPEEMPKEKGKGKKKG